MYTTLEIAQSQYDCAKSFHDAIINALDTVESYLVDTCTERDRLETRLNQLNSQLVEARKTVEKKRENLQNVQKQAERDRKLATWNPPKNAPYGAYGIVGIQSLFPFGKYKKTSFTVKDVIDNDLDYMCWCLRDGLLKLDLTAYAYFCQKHQSVHCD